jgi:D-alanyl-D-alanine carboxypeptidase/D-alanyl-D-alanine-endopeptidase (penicillin-binding protein 4)
MSRRSAHSRRRNPTRRPILLSLLALILVVAGALVAGTATLHGHRLFGHAPTRQSSPNASPAPTVSGASSGPALWALTPSPAAAVLSPLAQLPATAPVPKTAALTARVAPLLADPALAGDTVAIVVADARSGSVLLDNHGSDPAVPASTAKIAVAIAALHALGDDHRFTTKTVLATGNRVVLVGGGDPTLAGPTAIGAHDPGYPAPARLADLVAQTASALKSKGISAVSVGYDASLFAGPLTGPAWKPLYINEGDVAPVSALEVDEGSPDLTKPQRAADPAGVAARQFATLLVAAGVQVTGTPVATKVTPDDGMLASVQSPRLSALVQRMLGRSDNDMAEALARQVAIATGKPATFAGGADAVRTTLAGLGVPASGLAMVDGSGLSPSDRVQPIALVRMVDLVLAGKHPELSSIAQALPVAGFSGTLTSRYTAPPAASAAGRVHAKTGTLDGVVALAGYLNDASGRVLAFALIANGVPQGATVRTEHAIDRLAAGIAGCGCS